MVLHPWHEVEVGENAPAEVHAIIEIPRGSRAKYELDKETGLIKLDRVLHGSMMYPTHYGIIPQTLFDDGDPLDILVLTDVPLVPLTLTSVRIVGVMRMIDQNVPDDKIIGVVKADPTVGHIQDIDDLPEHFFVETRHFFENYTKLEGKSVQVPTFLGKEAAFEAIVHSQKLYNEAFPK